MPKPDIITSNQGAIRTFCGNTRRGRAWIMRNIADSDMGAAVAEHRHGSDIVMGALNDGLRLQDAATGRFAPGTGPGTT